MSVGEPETIQPNDVVLCFNFRTDRCRQITRALTQENFEEFGMKKIELDFTTMTCYDETFEGVKNLYRKDDLSNTLGEVIAASGKSQLRMAETEKYPHVTFFFSGGREAPFENEHRIVVPSPKVATYDLQPEMSADRVKESAQAYIMANGPDFLCLNFANPDMVGHTGVFDAIVKACETVDQCLSELVSTLRENDYDIIVIADHGNADYVVNPDGSPNTAHSLNPVPVWYIGDRPEGLNSGILANVAPTILDIMGIEAPSEFSHKSLLN
jgi:2,3-bisphosphoglycerate-independent phosphoglycerate mutase